MNFVHKSDLMVVQNERQLAVCCLLSKALGVVLNYEIFDALQRHVREISCDLSLDKLG